MERERSIEREREERMGDRGRRGRERKGGERGRKGRE